MTAKHLNITVDEETLDIFDKKRGLIPRSALIEWLMQQYISDTMDFSKIPNGDPIHCQ